MKLVVLTGVVRGSASRCLPALCRNPALQVMRVLLTHNDSPNRRRVLLRKIKKLFRVGPLGALNNAFRLRGWYRNDDVDDIHEVCRRLGVPLFESDYMNCAETVRLVKEADADLGLSLSCGYIGKSVFSVPKFGTINIHTEVLPRFRSASIIWPIYEGVQETGFTIHQVDSQLDTGETLYQKKYPIVFYPTLRETVEENLKIARSQIPDAFSYVCENYESLRAKAVKQSPGTYRTTPTFAQYLRMVRNHRRMYRESSSKFSAGRNPVQNHETGTDTR